MFAMYLLKLYRQWGATFDYFDKTLVVLSATRRRISIIISFVSIIGAPVGRRSASFSVICSMTTRIIKKLLKIIRNEKKKYDNIAILTRSKLNSPETPISQALIDPEITHDEYKAIINEEENYRRLK